MQISKHWVQKNDIKYSLILSAHRPLKQYRQGAKIKIHSYFMIQKLTAFDGLDDVFRIVNNITKCHESFLPCFKCSIIQLLILKKNYFMVDRSEKIPHQNHLRCID